MARKPVQRELPLLKELFPDFRALPRKAHRLHLASEYMKKAALRLRTKRNQPFYSMREAAKFLTLPVSTLGLAYQSLENEGLIVRVRGSRTVLLGKVIQTLHPARSIVSIPVALSSLVSSHFTRRFCDRISDELWKHHFVANLILVKALDDATINFARRLVNQSDIVIWLFPSREIRGTILNLRDHGLRTIILRGIEDPFMQADYLMDWTTVYKRVLLDWKSSGIRHVVVAKPSRPERQKLIESFVELLREMDYGFTLAEANAVDLRDQVEQRLKNKIRVGCAVLEHESSHRLCNSDPVTMARLTTRCRMLFGRGRIHASYFFNRNFRADVIGFDGDQVAERVSKDLGRRMEKNQPASLLPLWMPKANLREVFI